MTTVVPREATLMDPEVRARLRQYAESIYKTADARENFKSPLTTDELTAWVNEVQKLRDAVLELVPRLPKL